MGLREVGWISFDSPILQGRNGVVESLGIRGSVV